MTDLRINSNNLNAPITFSGLCPAQRTIDISNGMFSEEVINDFIIIPGEEEIPIESISKINVSSNILNYKVFETPGNTTSNYVENYSKKRITGKKLSVSGVICLDITITNPITGANEILEGKLPFVSYIVVPKTTMLTDKFEISCCVQNVNAISIVDFILTVSVSFTVHAKKNQIFPLVISDCSCASSNPLTTIGITPSDTLKKLIISTDKTWNEVSFSRNLILPGELPNAKSVTSIFSKIKVVSQSIINLPTKTSSILNYYGENVLGKKLIIEAILSQRINYSAKNENNTVHSLIINLPVSCYIMLPNETQLTPKFKIEAYIEDLYSCCINERTLFSGAILFFKAIKQDSCTSLYANKSRCSCSDNFKIDYKFNNLCDESSITSITTQGSWNEVSIYRRMYTSLDYPIRFIKNASTDIKIVSIDTAKTPNSNGTQSQEGFLLTSFIAIVNGYAITTVSYNADTTAGSVITNTFYIPFSQFIILGEDPNSSNKKVAITHCIENLFVNVLDKNGIGVYIQLLLKAKLVDKN